jgi:hypothetical protein
MFLYHCWGRSCRSRSRIALWLRLRPNDAAPAPQHWFYVNTLKLRPQTGATEKIDDWQNWNRWLKDTLPRGARVFNPIDSPLNLRLKGSATIRATQHIINASYNQRQRFFHLCPEPRML